MQLMWAFYGYSRPFVLILGGFEILGGLLMFIKRTRILGCLFITIILTNVILQDIFYSVNVGALKAAIIYQFLIICILWFNKQKLIQCFKILISIEKIEISTTRFFIKILISIFLFIIIRIFEYYATTKW